MIARLLLYLSLTGLAQNRRMQTKKSEVALDTLAKEVKTIVLRRYDLVREL